MFHQVRIERSMSGRTTKYVCEYAERPAVAEVVSVRKENGGWSIGLSTQFGCAGGCTHCGVGTFFGRSFSAAEIYAQWRHAIANERIDPRSERIEVNFTVMGEALLNFRNVASAIRQIAAEGPGIEFLLCTICPRVPSYDHLCGLGSEIRTVTLQCSVHASTDTERNRMIPYPNKYTLAEISSLGEEWLRRTGDRPYFNYCVHRANARDEDIDRLEAVFAPRTWRVNVSIVCNSDESDRRNGDRLSSCDELATFESRMAARGYETRLYDPDGEADIGAGSGQLWGAQAFAQQRPHLVQISAGAAARARNGNVI